MKKLAVKFFQFPIKQKKYLLVFIMLCLLTVMSGKVLINFLDSNSLANDNIAKKIISYNSQQEIRNKDKFGNLRNDSIVIVVQVHKRITYLRHLISSLSTAQNISDTLLIFSHDFYDEEINELVQSIEFCKVMQIFYPFSLQLFSNKFPGTDPKDCSRNMTKKQATSARCNNALYPDTYGHYREANFTQLKHHWWWKANQIFDRLEATRDFDGSVIFLEEDHYVTEDLLYVLKLIQKSFNEICPDCNIISLGLHYNYIDRVNFNKVDMRSFENLGVTFNRSLWLDIKSCSKYFCTFDDYNWDWTLEHINYSCSMVNMKSLVLTGPRVFHVGNSGMHHSATELAQLDLLSKVKENIENSKHLLFPTRIEVSNKIFRPSEYITPNGGWSDPRDIAMCLQMTF